MSRVYFDTGIIVKLYVQEATTPRAIELFKCAQAPPLCHWQRFETRNAIRLKAFRHEIHERQATGSLRNFDADIGAGVWQAAPIDSELLFRRAEALSEAHSVTHGVRTMDIVHVAAALILGVDAFASFDRRQGRLAEEAGLRVLG